MLAVIVTIAVVLVVAGIAAFAVVAARRNRKPVVAAGPELPVAVMRPEVATAAHANGSGAAAPPAPVAAPLFDLTLESAPRTPTPPLESEPQPSLESVPFEPRLSDEPVRDSPSIIETPPLADVTWAKSFDSRSGTLDDTARLRLIGDLGVVGKEWCVPLLCEAYAQEQRPANRQAALIALAECGSRSAIATYKLALESTDSTERAIATDALADLEPATNLKQRAVVERR